MTFVVSDAHQAAVQEALRLQALNARLALLTEPEDAPIIHFYGGALPDPWGTQNLPEPRTPLVIIEMPEAVGTVDEEEIWIDFITPIEGQVDGADPQNGTEATWAAIYTGNGDLWGYGTVSDTEGNGDFKLQETLFLQGAFVRVTSAKITG